MGDKCSKLSTAVGDTRTLFATPTQYTTSCNIAISKYNNLEKVESPGVQAEGLEKTFHL